MSEMIINAQYQDGYDADYEAGYKTALNELQEKQCGNDIVLASKLAFTKSSSVLYDYRDCYKYIDDIYNKLSGGYHLGFLGSNHMFRNLDWIGTIEECINTFGCIPIGSFAFKCRTENMMKPERYHKDDLPDAYMIGIACNREKLGDKWTHVGLSRKIFYSTAINEYLDRRYKNDNAREV